MKTIRSLIQILMLLSVISSFSGCVETQNLGDVIAIDNSANDQIKNLADPTDTQDAATKNYVDVYNEALRYSVGDFAHGGIVFWVDETGHHGLVCARGDLNARKWNKDDTRLTGAYHNGLFAGKMNTLIIISAQVASGDDPFNYAAGRLSFTVGQLYFGDYGDWYLPSIYELNLMYQNKAIIDSTATANGGSAFANALYWSSNELKTISGRARIETKNFSNGDKSVKHPDVQCVVRAIRAF